MEKMIKAREDTAAAAAARTARALKAKMAERSESKAATKKAKMAERSEKAASKKKKVAKKKKAKSKEIKGEAERAGWLVGGQCGEGHVCIKPPPGMGKLPEAVQKAHREALAHLATKVTAVNEAAVNSIETPDASTT